MRENEHATLERFPCYTDVQLGDIPKDGVVKKAGVGRWGAGAAWRNQEAETHKPSCATVFQGLKAGGHAQTFANSI